MELWPCEEPPGDLQVEMLTERNLKLDEMAFPFLLAQSWPWGS